VAANGNVTQCYPASSPAGINPATAVPGENVRQPCEGQVTSLQCLTDGTNAFIIELYDISGIEIGVDVSSAAVISNAQLVAAIAAGRATLIFEQNVAGSGLTPFAPIGPFRIMKGIAARAVGASGTCKLNMVVQGCVRGISGSN